MEKISITRALSELKLTDKKIQQQTASLDVIAGVREGQPVSGMSQKDFVEKAKAQIQSVTDLIDRRNNIKNAIIKSNANTIVKVGPEKMTVAQAIDRKGTIETRSNLYQKMRKGMINIQAEVEKVNTTVQQRANESAKEMFQTDNNSKDINDKFQTHVESFFKHNKFNLVAPEGIKEVIESMGTEIDNFESEVDFVLSESNAKTMVKV